MKGHPGIEPLPLRYRSASSNTLMLGAPRIQSWTETSAGAYIYPAMSCQRHQHTSVPALAAGNAQREALRSPTAGQPASGRRAKGLYRRPGNSFPPSSCLPRHPWPFHSHHRLIPTDSHAGRHFLGRTTVWMCGTGIFCCIVPARGRFDPGTGGCVWGVLCGETRGTQQSALVLTFISLMADGSPATGGSGHSHYNMRHGTAPEA